MEQDGSARQERFQNLLSLVARLRGDDGCPWDRAQTSDDIGRCLLDESYEVLDALANGSPADLREELGDLLFQILFLAQLAEEEGQFDIGAVLDGIIAKMIRRHPHVFGETKVNDEADVRRNWEQIKREVEHKIPKAPALTEGIGRSLPTLAKAQRVQARAAAIGFDWPDIAGVLEKLEEESAEFRSALAVGDRRKISEEAGDLLFTVVNLCRFAATDAEAALRTSLNKFLVRFAYVEAALASQGRTLGDVDLDEMDALWEEAKKKGSSPGS